MSKLGPEPRVNGKLLKQHTGQTVRLTCKVIQIQADKATVQASDGTEVALWLSRDMNIADPYVEIIGSVKEDGTVKALTNINLGKNIDMKAVDSVVEFAHSSLHASKVRVRDRNGDV